MTKIRFRETIRKLKMDTLLRECGTVIVGYSGGADSSCLLRFMKKWCDENGVGYVIDSTNAEADCMRNAVRHKIVPVMRELCASPEESATRMTSLLRTDDAFLDRTARSYATDRTDIGRETLMSLDDAVASRVLIMLYDNAKTTDSTVSETQIYRILHLVREKSGHSEVSLAGGMRAVIERDSVSVVPCPPDAEKCGDALFE